MPLTAAQLTAIGNDIAANTATAPGTSGQIKDLPHTADNAFAVAAWYNQFPAVDFWGNYAAVPVNDILSAITWKNFTPTDAVPTDTALNVAIWNARNAMCQTLQMNIQNLIIGRQSIDGTKGKTRTGFQDSLSSVPSGVAGASKDAGWAAVQKILCRKGTNAEKLFADTGSGDGSANTTAATFIFEGQVSDTDIRAIWGI